MIWNATYPDEPVLRLVLFGRVNRIVDKSKSGGLSTSELGAESENKNGLCIANFVQLGKLLLQLSLTVHITTS